PISSSAGSSPGALACADLDGDGLPDLAVTDGGRWTLSVLTNRGNGMFALDVTYPLGGFPTGIASADLDRAGDADVAVSTDTTAQGSVAYVFRNDGTGVFGAPAQYALGDGANALASVDLAGSGAPDLAATNSTSHTLSVLMNRGNGTFAPQV